MNRQAFWIVPALALALAAPAAAKDNKNQREKQRNRVMRGAVRADDDWYGARGGRRDLGNRFRGIDRNGDGVITRKEWPGNDKSFNQHDLNRDGILAGREVRAGGRRDARGDRRTSALPIADAMSALPGLASYRAAIDSEDAIEGPRAFAEKRDPIWRGR